MYVGRFVSLIAIILGLYLPALYGQEGSFSKNAVRAKIDGLDRLNKIKNVQWQPPQIISDDVSETTRVIVKGQAQESLNISSSSKAPFVVDAKEEFQLEFVTSANDQKHYIQVVAPEGKEQLLQFRVRQQAVLRSTPPVLSANPSPKKMSEKEPPLVDSRALEAGLENLDYSKLNPFAQCTDPSLSPLASDEDDKILATFPPEKNKIEVTNSQIIYKIDSRNYFDFGFLKIEGRSFQISFDSQKKSNTLYWAWPSNLEIPSEAEIKFSEDGASQKTKMTALKRASGSDTIFLEVPLAIKSDAIQLCGWIVQKQMQVCSPVYKKDVDAGSQIYKRVPNSLFKFPATGVASLENGAFLYFKGLEEEPLRVTNVYQQAKSKSLVIEGEGFVPRGAEVNEEENWKIIVPLDQPALITETKKQFSFGRRLKLGMCPPHEYERGRLVVPPNSENYRSEISLKVETPLPSQHAGRTKTLSKTIESTLPLESQFEKTPLEMVSHSGGRKIYSEINFVKMPARELKLDYGVLSASAGYISKVHAEFSWYWDTTPFLSETTSYQNIGARVSYRAFNKLSGTGEFDPIQVVRVGVPLRFPGATVEQKSAWVIEPAFRLSSTSLASNQEFGLVFAREQNLRPLLGVSMDWLPLLGTPDRLYLGGGFFLKWGTFYGQGSLSFDLSRRVRLNIGLEYETYKFVGTSTRTLSSISGQAGLSIFF